MRDEVIRNDVAGLLRVARREAGLTQRELAYAAATSQAAVARYEAGAVLPDLRTLSRLVEACGRQLRLEAASTRRRRGGRSGRESAVVRPVPIPTDIDDPAVVKAHGIVGLPAYMRWIGPPRAYDLSKRRDRARVYEQVLREGTKDDIRRFVRLDDLVDLWDELVLPQHVRTSWERWLTKRTRAALNPLQERIARLVTSLPTAEGFALAGGAALIVHGVVDRRTNDLDFFSTSAEAVGRLYGPLEQALDPIPFS